jgi:hypothetical protein
MKRRFILMVAAVSLLGVGFSGCSKDDDDNNTSNPTTPSVTVNSSPQATFKVDGVAVSIVDGVNNVTGVFSNQSFLATFPDSSETVFGYGLSRDNGSTFENLLDVEKGTYRFTTSDSATFSAFFPEQSYTYSAVAENGIRIVYYDAAGNPWSTDAGTANQTGSTFTIQDTKFTELLGDKYMFVKATFNCKVYDGSGASKVITDGVGVFHFWSEY